MVTADQTPVDPDTFKQDLFGAQGDEDAGWGDRNIYDNLRAGQILVDGFEYSAASTDGVSDDASATFYVTGVNDVALISASAEDGTLTRDIDSTNLTAGVYVGQTDVAGGKMLVWDADAFTNGWVFGKGDVFALDEDGEILLDDDGNPVRASAANDYREAYLVESFDGEAPEDAAGTETGSKDFQYEGTYGTFTFTYEPTTVTDLSGFVHPDYETGQYAWSYALDRNNIDVGFLPSGQFLEETLTLTSLDGTDTFTITIRIEGSYVPPPPPPPPVENAPPPPPQTNVAAAAPTLETTGTEAAAETNNPVLSSTQSNSPAIASTANPVLNVSQGSGSVGATAPDITGLGSSSTDTGGGEAPPAAPSSSGDEARYTPSRFPTLRFAEVGETGSTKTYTFEVRPEALDDAPEMALSPVPGADILNTEWLTPLTQRLASDATIRNDDMTGARARATALPRFSAAMRDAVAQL